MEQRLKIGIVLQNGVMQQYEKKIVEELLECKACQVVLLISLKIKQKNRKSNLLYRTYFKLHELFNKSKIEYIQKVTIEDLSRQLNVIELPMDGSKAVQNGNLKKIADSHLDLLLNFGQHSIPKNILPHAKYGIWSLFFGSTPKQQAMPLFDEIYQNKPYVTISLWQHSNSANETIPIDQMNVAINTLFYISNINYAYWKSYKLVVRNIKRLAKEGERFISIKPNDLYFFKDVIYVKPNNLQLILLLSKLMKRISLKILERLLYKEQWVLYYAKNESNQTLVSSLDQYLPLLPTKDFFWADPFVVDKGNSSYIFFEELPFASNKGHLCVVALNHDTDTVSKPVKIMDKNYHLSYPFVFEYENDYYMIPESSADKKIKLYRAKNFPDNWEEYMVLMDNIEAIDATLHYHNNQWWLFACIIEKNDLFVGEDLHIFYSDCLFSRQWTPHPMNPVVSDIARARPAGKIFEFGGALYRPSQNSTQRYGRCTNFNKIEYLDEHHYKERFISEITPDYIDGAISIHTFNTSEKLTIIDAQKRVSRLKRLL